MFKLHNLMNIVWGWVIFCCLIGFFQGVIVVLRTDDLTAMQQIADAVMGIAWAVIPYCLARSIQGQQKEKASPEGK
ncbi:hypothetical protein [Serratia ureilytica]|nr:hypothetical protein [Serratia ureilytica]